ncbi:MAG: ABC transporter permease subunit [Dermatophilaceae bacterium]
MSGTEPTLTATPAPALSPADGAPTAAGPRLGVWSLLRSELGLIGGRRRNQFGLLVLAAVPVLIAVVTRMSASRGGAGASFFGSITSNGLFVALAALTVEMPMFLPLAMAMLSGDAIAGEANLGTLRYLLTVPVSRTRLVLVKYLALCVGALWGLAVVVGVGGIVGVALFGTGPMTTLSGTQIGFGDALVRLALAMLYLGAGLAALAAVGLFVSTLTEQPIAATIGVMIFTITSWILAGIPQVSWLHPYLLVSWFMSFADLYRDPVWTAQIANGLTLFAGYAVVFVSLAWARCSTKDITS